jgi:predicted membrane protein
MKREKNLETILAMCFGFLILHLIFHIKVLLTLSILLAAIGLFSDYLSNKVTWVWLKISELIGAVMGKILMGTVFFIFLTPIAFLMRTFGKPGMRLKKPAHNTLYNERNHTYTASDLEDIW